MDRRVGTWEGASSPGCEENMMIKLEWKLLEDSSATPNTSNISRNCCSSHFTGWTWMVSQKILSDLVSDRARARFVVATILFTIRNTAPGRAWPAPWSVSKVQCCVGEMWVTGLGLVMILITSFTVIFSPAGRMTTRSAAIHLGRQVQWAAPAWTLTIRNISPSSLNSPPGEIWLTRHSLQCAQYNQSCHQEQD